MHAVGYTTSWTIASRSNGRHSTGKLPGTACKSRVCGKPAEAPSREIQAAADGNSRPPFDLSSAQSRPLTAAEGNEMNRSFPPDGKILELWSNGELKTLSFSQTATAPVAPATEQSIAPAVDGNVQSAFWMPDSTSMVVVCNDGDTGSFWLQPLGAKPRRSRWMKFLRTARPLCGPELRALGLHFQLHQSSAPTRLPFFPNGALSPWSSHFWLPMCAC